MLDLDSQFGALESPWRQVSGDDPQGRESLDYVNEVGVNHPK